MTLAVAFAYLLGSVIGSVLRPPWPPWPPWPLWSGAGVLLLSITLCLPDIRHRVFAGAGRSHIAMAAIACAAALCVTGAYVARQLELRWPLAREGERIIATAHFVSIPVLAEFGWTVDAELNAEPRFRLRPSRVRLTWRSPPVRLHVGDRWQLLVQLRPTRAALNPGSPDMERQWFRERIHALGHVVRSPLNRRIERGGPSLDALRARIARDIGLRVPDRDAAALFAALAVGVTGDVSRTQWSVFSATGTTHLVAISGLHVTLFAWLAMGAARRVWSLWERLHARISRDTFAAVCGVLAALVYALLAGFSVPTQRTWVMLTAFLVSTRIGRAHSGAAAFATSLILVLALDVLAPLSSGFWLSFGAVAAILLASSTRVARRGSAVFEAIRIQAVVALALMPLTVLWFGGISIASFVVNFLAIPVFTIVLVPLVLVSTLTQYAMPFVGDLGWGAALLVHELGWPLLEDAAQWPGALLRRAPSGPHIALAVAAAAVAILPWPLLLRAIACVGLMPLIWPTDHAPRLGGVTITSLTMGHSPSVVVRTSTHTLLHGVGEQFGSGGSRASRVVVPALLSTGVERVDRMILPRVNRDIVAGAAEIAVSIPIVELLTGAPWFGASTPYVECRVARPWLWNGAHFAFVSETCVMTMGVGERRLAIAGEGHQPGDLLAAAIGGPLDTVLLPRLTAAHDAAIATLIDAGLRVLVETAAVRGRGAGRAAILARLADAGVEVRSVAVTGSAIELTVPENGPGGVAARRMGARWSWRHGPV